MQHTKKSPGKRQPTQDDRGVRIESKDFKAVNKTTLEEERENFLKQMAR